MTKAEAENPHREEGAVPPNDEANPRTEVVVPLGGKTDLLDKEVHHPFSTAEVLIHSNWTALTRVSR